MHESKQEKETSVSQLTEEILSRKNMALAYRKVKANKGASGVDGISVDEVLFELNRLVPNGMPGGVRGGRNFPLLDYF